MNGEDTTRGAAVRAGGRRRGRQLTRCQIVKMAWQNIRLRRGRAIMVAAGIVLALAFLSYSLASNAIENGVDRHAPSADREQLLLSGALVVSGPDARIQMRWIVGLAMLVSFVGVLNAMLLSVAERFREIGTMKCLGARDGLVVQIFLVESLFEGVAGTVAGIVLGLGLALAEGWGRFGGLVWACLDPAVMARVVVMVAVAGMSLTLGGALYPAWRAARMAPVAALRSEV